jgi:hypothetical protein
MTQTVRILLLALFFLTTNLKAQSPTATISGIVTDAQGSVIPGATVVAVNPATSARITATTNAQGFYVLTQLPITSYTVEAEMTGFKKYVRQGLVVTTGATTALDIQMEVGGADDSVTVTGEAPLLQTRSSDVSTLIESKNVQDLPIGDRRTLNLVKITGAAVFVNYDAGGKPNFSLAGGRTQSQMFWIDGGSGQNMRLGIGQVDIDPPVETVQEVKIMSNSYSAEYGGSAGGVIIATTKSGTNEFHGALYEYLRNDALDAANYFAPIVNGKKQRAPLRYNVFGGTIGGPVYLPKFGEGGRAVYDGHNRTFFFFGYEGSRRKEGQTRVLTVPTLKMRAGDFSEFPGNIIYDPATSRVLNGRIVRDAFPNQIIPASRIDPVAAKLLAFYPLPNATGLANNFRGNYQRILTRDNFTAKVDHNFTDKDKINVRYLYNSDNLGYTSVFPNIAAETLAPALRHQHYWYFGYTRVISSNVINEARYTYSNRINNEQSFGFDEAWPGQLGLKGVPNQAFPNINVTGVTSLGAGQHARAQLPIQQHQFVDNLSITRGRHTFKMGGEARLSDNFEITYTSVSGQYGFVPQATGLPGQAATGLGFASLLLGQANSLNLRVTDDLKRQSWYYSAFLQDDWTINQRLTLNLGVRWETDTPIKDTRGRMNSFDLTAINPVSGTPGVIKFLNPGDTPYDTDWNNFGPRFGFAWRPFENTVVRGGAGIFFAHPFDRGAPNSASLGYERSASLTSADAGTTPAFLLNVGPPALNLTSPTRNDSFGAVQVGRAPNTSPSFFERNRPSGYAQQFNLGIQREFKGGFLVEISGLGNLGRKLASPNLNMNQITPATLAAIPANTTPAQRDRPFPQFNNVTILAPSIGTSNYYAGILRAEKRYAKGFNLIGSYTWSKFLTDTDDGGSVVGNGFGYSNYYNRRADYGPSGNDIRHRLSVSGVYDLPFGKGKRWLNDSPLNWALGNWNVSVISILQSGPPVNITTQVNNTFAFSAGAQRADVIGNPELPKSDRTLNRWFNTAAFAQPANRTFGTAARGIVRGDGLVNFDITLRKNFVFTETRVLQFNVDFFNAFNHPNFGLPGGGFGAPGFGVVGSANPGRSLQAGLRFAY